MARQASDRNRPLVARIKALDPIATSSSRQFPPAGEQLPDDGGGFLPQSRLEPRVRGELLVLDRRDLARTQLPAGNEGDVGEIVGRRQVVEVNLTISGVPAADTP